MSGVWRGWARADRAVVRRSLRCLAAMMLAVGRMDGVVAAQTLKAEALPDLELTRGDRLHLRRAMGDAAREFEPFEEADARADWSRFERLPLFGVAHRINAYNTYLLMEQEVGR